MIVSNLENSSRVYDIHPLFKKLFEYLESHDLLNEELGRITIEGDDLFINNVNPQCVELEQQKLELHRDYIDIHILLEGEEKIGWKAIEDLEFECQAYDKDSDCSLFSDKPDVIVPLKPGQFLIAFPEDAHAPIIGEGKIRKLIAKIKI